jgi:hypothetical protein
MKILCLLFLLIETNFAQAANSLPVSIDQMLNEAEVVIEGIVVKDQITKKNSNLYWHEIYLEPTLSLGLNEVEKDKNHLIHIYYELSNLDQAHFYRPNFASQEQAVFILNRTNNRLNLKHKGMGVFKIKSRASKLKLISALIPMHPSYGQMDYLDFIALASAHLGGEIQKHTESEAQLAIKDGQKSLGQDRSPAMLQEVSLNEPDRASDLSGLIFMLMLMCLAWRYSLIINRK